MERHFLQACQRTNVKFASCLNAPRRFWATLVEGAQTALSMVDLAVIATATMTAGTVPHIQLRPTLFLRPRHPLR